VPPEEPEEEDELAAEGRARRLRVLRSTVRRGDTLDADQEQRRALRQTVRARPRDISDTSSPLNRALARKAAAAPPIVPEPPPAVPEPLPPPAPHLPPGRGNRKTRRKYGLDDSAEGAAGKARLAAEAAAAAAAAAAPPPVAAAPGAISSPPPPPPSAAALQEQAAALKLRAANLRAQATEATRLREAADAEAERLRRPSDANLRAEADAEVAAGLAAVPPPAPVVNPENEVNVVPPAQAAANAEAAAAAASKPLGALQEAEAAAARAAAARNPPGNRLITSDGRDITPTEPFDPAQRAIAGLPKLNIAQKNWIVKRDPTWRGKMLGGRRKSRRRRTYREPKGLFWF